MRLTNDAEILRMNNEGITTTKIAEYYGVSTSAIRQRLRKMGVDNSQKRRKPIYELDVNFFRKWSPAMAYVLGFIITDGNVSGNTVSISQKYPEPLQYIRDALNSNAPIKEKQSIYQFSVNRKSVVEDLAKLGVMECKSLTVGLPDVPTKYLPDFIRGVIDGDGYVHPKGYVITITSGSQTFAEQITTLLNAQGFPFRCEHDGYAFRIKLSGKASVNNFGNWLYNAETTYAIDYKKNRMIS